MRIPSTATELSPSLLLLLVLAAACAPKRIALPSGAGTPFPDGAAAYTAAVQECRGARTIEATLGLSGRAGSQGLRGNVDAGFEAPDKIRLEGRPPIGRPVFILAASGPEGTLYLPRDNRVIRNTPPAAIVEALVGLPLGAGELHALISGCGFAVAEPSAGRTYPGGWVAVDAGNATTYLQQKEGPWRIVAAVRPPLTVYYADFVSGRPSSVRIQSSGTPAADVRVRLSDVNINTTLESAVFVVDVPAGAQPLTLDELRRAGPLGGQ